MKGLTTQASKMLNRSNSLFKPIEIGKTVRIPIPEVDRAKTDSKNMIGVVIETSNGLYKVGTKWGVLKQHYSRNQLFPTDANFISISEVPESVISLRKAANSESLTGGQGFVKCNCKTKCNDKKCKCRKMNLLCNSKCHISLSCLNKKM